MSSVDEYIKNQSETVRSVLTKVRAMVLSSAPDVLEGIAYGMPAYKLAGKPLVYFAAQKKHLGFYATPSGHEAFADRLSGYKHGKGSVQFPFDSPIPYDLIREMVEFRVRENETL